MAFDSGTTNAGSGGLTLAVNTFTDADAVARTAPFSQLAFGVMDAIPTIVSASNGLPVAQQGTWNVGTVTTVTTVGAVTAITNALPAGSNVIGGVTQSGTWNVTNVSGTISLPTGASTAAKQPALGTAGTASADVLTVQGIASMTALKVDGSAVTQPVSGTVTATVSGVSTAANQTTIIGHVDGIETLLGTIDADTGNISTKIDMLAGAVSGTEFQVDVLTMPTVTVNAHAVTNAGTFVVQENGAALTALQLIDDTVTTLGTDTYTEATSKGITIGAVRRDADTTLVNTTNEFGPLQMDANGRLKVEAFSGETLPVSLTSTTITGTVAATQSGTWNVGTVTTLTGITNVVHIDDNASTISVDDGGASLTIDDGGSSITVDGTVGVSGTVAVSGTFWQATQPVSIAAGASTTAKAEDAASANADVGVPSMAVRKATPANTSDTDGDYEMLQMSAGRLWVDPSGVTLTVASHAVTNAGTFAVQVDGTALTKLTDIETNTDSGAVVGNGAAATAQRVTLANDSTGIVALTTSTASIGKLASNAGVTIGAVEIASAQTLATVTTLTGGGIAHDSADSGNPVKVGSKAFATLSTATLVAAADRTDQVSDLDGAIIVRDSATAADYVSGQATNTDGTSTQCLAAAGSGVKLYLTDVALANSSATAITVDIKDGTTVKWTFPVPAGAGVVFSFKTPLVGTANTAWNFDGSAAATTLSCSMSAYKSKL